MRYYGISLSKLIALAHLFPISRFCGIVHSIDVIRTLDLVYSQGISAEMPRLPLHIHLFWAVLMYIQSSSDSLARLLGSVEKNLPSPAMVNYHRVCRARKVWMFREKLMSTCLLPIYIVLHLTYFILSQLYCLLPVILHCWSSGIVYKPSREAVDWRLNDTDIKVLLQLSPPITPLRYPAIPLWK